jgi:oxygen-dependent protoporphyrinogen oxidase
MRSESAGDYWLNYGAHLFPGPGSLVDEMARACGLEAAPVTGSMMGLALGSTLLNRGRVETYPFRLPLSVRERVAFARAGLRVQRGVRRYHRLEQRRDFEDDRTFADFLGPLPGAVHDVFSCAAHRATAELDELSAGCGIGLFALVWGGKRSLIARNLLGGSGRLPEALGLELGERARTRCPVHAIRPAGEELVVHFEDGEASARHVIVATQAPHAAQLLEPVSARAADALSQLTYGAFLTVAIRTRETSAMPYDELYAMATPGRVFDMFTNQAHVLRSGPRRPGGSLMLFAGGHAARELMGESDERIVERFTSDLHALYPQTRGVIADAKVQRWPLGNVYARPGRSRLQAALDGPLGAHRNLHLAGDYFAELGNIEAAARTGVAAAERVDARIRATPTREVTHV